MLKRSLICALVLVSLSSAFAEVPKTLSCKFYSGDRTQPQTMTAAFSPVLGQGINHVASLTTKIGNRSIDVTAQETRIRFMIIRGGDLVEAEGFDMLSLDLGTIAIRCYVELE